MSLPSWVRAKCRIAMQKPVSSMAERASNAREEAYKHGYLYDFVEREFVYVGTEDREAVAGPSANLSEQP